MMYDATTSDSGRLQKGVKYTMVGKEHEEQFAKVEPLLMATPDEWPPSL